MCFCVIWLIFVFNSRPHGPSCPLLSTFKVLLRALHQDECWPHQCPECAEMFSLPVIRASCLPPRPLRPALPVGPLAQLCTNKASTKHRTDPFPQFHFFQIWKCIPAFGRLPEPLSVFVQSWAVFWAFSFLQFELFNETLGCFIDSDEWNCCLLHVNALWLVSLYLIGLLHKGASWTDVCPAKQKAQSAHMTARCHRIHSYATRGRLCRVSKLAMANRRRALI